MTTGNIQPLSEEQFRSLVNKLDQASQSLTERERAFVIEAFKEGVASDEDDVQGYAQLVETAAGDVTPIAEPLSQDERQALRQKLSQIGEQLTPEERAFVQSVFVRGAQSLNEVQGYQVYYSFSPYYGWEVGSISSTGQSDYSQAASGVADVVTAIAVATYY